MKYYDGHENVYAKIEKDGGKSWADRTGGQGLEVEHANLKPVLEQLFATVTFSGAPLDAMDLGCGTGETSLFLARHFGVAVVALDKRLDEARLASRAEGEG